SESRCRICEVNSSHDDAKTVRRQHRIYDVDDGRSNRLKDLQIGQFLWRQFPLRTRRQTLFALDPERNKRTIFLLVGPGVRRAMRDLLFNGEPGKFTLCRGVVGHVFGPGKKHASFSHEKPKTLASLVS